MKSFHSRTHRPAPEREPAARTPVERPAGLERADVLVVARNLATSRALARRLIERGLICFESGVVVKASQRLPVGAHLALCDASPSQENSQGLDET